MNLQQQKKLKRTLNITENGESGIIHELDVIDDKIDTTKSILEEKVDRAIIIAEETQKMEVIGPKGEKGDSGYTPIKGIDYVDGVDGRNPLTVSDTEPLNPKTGDLWYKN